MLGRDETFLVDMLDAAHLIHLTNHENTCRNQRDLDDP
jgi:hypothetical protein